MPRAEDIAWKFVTRQGRKWRCPYCKNEYSGSVTRVKSHLLKQPKEGVAPCTKVPEPISTLVELLHNQVRNKEDIAWKFIDSLGENKWRCHHCREEFFGDLTGVKDHLLGVPNEGISICTGVLENVRTLMRSSLDEVAEEESREVADEQSRGAYGQFPMEPQSLYVLTQAEVAEEESREAYGQFPMEPQSLYVLTQAEVAEEESKEANGQFSTEPQSREMPSPAVPSPLLSFGDDMGDFLITQEWATDMATFTSDQERQFPETLAMASLAQNSHGKSMSYSTMALAEAEALHDLPDQSQCNIRSQMQMNDQQTPAVESASQYDQLPAVGNSNCLQDGNQHSQQAEVGAEEESREANGQLSMEPQLHDMPTQAEVAEEDSREANSQSYMEPQSLYVLTQAEVAEEESGETNSQFSTEPQSCDMLPPAVPMSPLSFGYDLDDLPRAEPLTDMANFAFNEEFQCHETLAMLSLAQNSHGESSLFSMGALEDEVRDPLDLPGQPECSFLSPCPEEMPTNDQQTPTGASLFQDDQLQTPMEVDPPIASQHTTESPIIEATDLEVPEVATNTTGPSSSQDMNRASPIMNVWSICANDEEIRNLKRKVEELNDKEVVTKEQMEIESAASSVRKKPRILVERWLKVTERATNNFQIISHANAEILPTKEQVETLTRETEPQTLLIEERDAKGDTFLERELTGEAIHRSIELIWGHLKKNHACKLGIYGMGGVGKTTIMKHIHNRLLEDATFDGVAFITVSQDFSIYKLQSDIWKALNFGFMKDEHEEKRAAKLSKRLERKKNCVLILDDVWERLDLEEMGIPVRADGFKLVLTTRSFNVCRQMQCQQKIKIEPLSEEEAEGLFLKELGSKVTLDLEIEAIVKSIVKECAGLPIGVITMARSMREVTEVSEWSDSLVKLRDSSIGQTDMRNRVLMKLKFSYDRLGKPDVQQCFLSCALYPEDKMIKRFKLVEFFIDQGLIGGLSTRKEQYDRGLSILNELENVCLLENHRGQVKMHDLIRDMALLIMSATSIVKAGKWVRRIPPEEYWTDVLEKVSLMENNIREFPLNFSPSCPKLSTLLLDYGLSPDVVIPDCFFEKLWGLKVLNLSGYNMSELPNSMSDLVNLRALLLRDCRELRCIPYLGKLTSLRKLDASGCESLEVLEGLEMLVNLRYLDLTETSIERLPKGTLDHLLNLQRLEVSAVNEEDITKLGAVETVGCYPQNADDFNTCVRVIEQSDNPRYYNLIVNLGISEFVAEVSDDARFGNLERSVKIEEWGHAIVSVGGEYTGIFILIPRDVQTMTMTKCNGITNLPSMGRLEYLEGPEIGERINLAVLRGGPDEVIDIHDSPAAAPTPLFFSSLRVLKIEECPKLKYLFVHDSKSNLPHLQKIEISDCEEMVGIIAAVTSPPPHLLPFFPSLEEISVECCGKMKRVVESEWMPHLPNLRIIKVLGCEKMEEIFGDPPPCLPVEEISLKSLDIGECDNMRKLFSHEWLLHLRNLQSIKVEWCEGMVEMISGAGQGQEGSTMTPVNNTPSSFQPSSISLPKLERLELYILPQLKSICEVRISCDSMKELVVDDCPELKEIPLQLQLHGIEELPHIYVEHEEKWKTLMWNHPNAQAILQPYLRNGKHAKYPFWWMGMSPPNAIELDARRKVLP